MAPAVTRLSRRRRERSARWFKSTLRADEIIDAPAMGPMAAWLR